MKKPDKFLIGIVAGVVLLVIVVLVLALRGSNQPAYQPDDTPEGVAHNYLLALHRQEYERAYSYLSPTLRGYPADADDFERDLNKHHWSFGYYDDDVSLAVEAVNVNDNRADIVIRKTSFYPGGLFDSGQSSSTFDMQLRHEDSGWKIATAGSYWNGCWASPDSVGCK